MFGKALMLTVLAAAFAGGLAVTPVAAMARPAFGVETGLQPVQWRGDRRGERGGRRFDGGRGFDRRDYDGRRDYDRGRSYRGRCRDKGTGGTIIGAIAGGLLGNAAVGRRGDGTAGAIVGGGVGALAGRAIDRDC